MGSISGKSGPVGISALTGEVFGALLKGELARWVDEAAS